MGYNKLMDADAITYEQVEDVSLQMARPDRSRLLESLDHDDGLSPER